MLLLYLVSIIFLNYPVVMEINIQGIDAEKGLDLCEGDLNTYLNLLRCYVTDVENALTGIKNISEETIKQYAACAHTIKGVSLAVGAEELSSKAKNMELMAKGGDYNSVTARNAAFIYSAENLVSNVRQWLKMYEGTKTSKN